VLLCAALCYCCACCAPLCCCAAVVQALFAADPGQLRSLSKGESHFGSFNRHFPVARCSSKTQEVHQVRPTEPKLQVLRFKCKALTCCSLCSSVRKQKKDRSGV
jgi:hypothetical protein